MSLECTCNVPMGSRHRREAFPLFVALLPLFRFDSDTSVILFRTSSSFSRILRGCSSGTKIPTSSEELDETVVS